MDGTTPSASLLDRIRTGQVGGVILFHRNFVDATHLRAITGKLKAAAVAGHRPHLLIAIDQEGGEVNQVPWAPPSLTPGQMGRSGQASIALQQGQSTGTALHNLGITTDLAPVGDVPVSTSSFMYQEHRTWSFRADVTARLSTAFAEGLDQRGTTATMKHFPGLGYATENTDYHVVHITATKTQLAPGLSPYRTAIAHGLPMIMLSNAGYSAYDRYNAAGWSAAIVVTLLRSQLKFHGVTITDSLDGTAHSRHLTTNSLAIRAAAAGTDMILSTGSEAATRSVYASLMTAARAGQIPPARMISSYNRILALKSRLG
jgi:beta-N-acetylhexosaminidase